MKEYACDNFPPHVVAETPDGTIELIDERRANPTEICAICEEFRERKEFLKTRNKEARKRGHPTHEDLGSMELHFHGGKAVFFEADYDLHLEEIMGYDRVVVAFSGGKDSLACLLHLFDLGVPRERIELWHHDVDGSQNDEHPDSEHRPFADWPCTKAYCKALADGLGVPIFYSWLSGGFEGELLRTGAKKPTYFETPEGVEVRVGAPRKQKEGAESGKLSRVGFPQVTANLSQRWCTAYLKIDVGRIALNNTARFLEKKILFLTGERAEESASRSNYAEFEAHESDLRNSTRGKRRHIDRWRPVHKWTEAQVWDIIKRYGVVPHPCYYLGWGRCSCAICVFGSPNQFASLREVMPERFEKLAEYEKLFGKTIQRDESVTTRANRGQPYEAVLDPDCEPLKDAINEVEWPYSVVLDPDDWVQPAGAFGESDGPT